MKQSLTTLALKTSCLLAMLMVLPGCVIVYGVFMRNTSAAAVSVSFVRDRHSHLYGLQQPMHWQYAPIVLPRRWASIAKLTDSLPVNVTADTVSLKLPAHSTVLVDIVHTGFQYKAVRLQRANAPVLVIDSTQMRQVFRFRVGKGSYWYDI